MTFPFILNIVGSKVLVVTGDPFGNGRHTEIIDLEDSSFSCSKVEQFPKVLYGAVGGLIGQTPFVCGGGKFDGSYSSYCYALRENGSWETDATAALNTERYMAATGSVLMTNKLVLAGGKASNRVSTIELASPNTRSTTLSVRLPVGLSHSCIVPWDSDTFMVIGGDDGGSKKKTYFVHMNNDTITNGPNLLKGRYYLACHEMIVNNEAFILVTGGHHVERSTEVLSKNNYRDGWKKGKHYLLK